MHIAVFDIGKTNKKFFVFDEQLAEVHREYIHIPETTDDDGFPCDDLAAIGRWMRETLHRVLSGPQFDIRYLNCSTYGATLVHLDENHQPVGPMYNYLKPFPAGLDEQLYDRFGGRDAFATRTASPTLGMLNAGLQLYWLKKKKPALFAQIRHTLHFPQYCSFLFSGRLYSEYTSIGCHTAMWDFSRGDYHPWLHEEELNRLLPPLVPAFRSEQTQIAGRTIAVGPGIHDSSAALLPYLLADDRPFLLLSTGTWNIALNPFSEEALTPADLNRDCLNFLRVDGRQVRASRLFLGNEHQKQLEKIAAHFGLPPEHHQKVTFDEDLLRQLEAEVPERVFSWEGLPETDTVRPYDLGRFPHFEAAYHQLIRELTGMQAAAIHLAAGQTSFRRIYLDGGFAGNDVFANLLSRRLPDCEWLTAERPPGSALGAALAVMPHNDAKGFGI